SVGAMRQARVLFRGLWRALAIALAVGCAAPNAPTFAQHAEARPASAAARGLAPERAAPSRLATAAERARALVAEMTLEEKLAAVVHVWDWTAQKPPEELCAVVPAGAGSFERIGLHRDPASTV